jgi:hypothetical protein
VPDCGNIHHCDSEQSHREPAGGNNAQTTTDHCQPDIIRPPKTDVERTSQKHQYGAKKLPAKKNHARGEGSHQTFPQKIARPWTARHFSREAWYTLAIAGLSEHKNETLLLFHKFRELYHNWLFVSQIMPRLYYCTNDVVYSVMSRQCTIKKYCNFLPDLHFSNKALLISASYFYANNDYKGINFKSGKSAIYTVRFI